ncbi:hypothetical protein ACFQMM_01095 [Saliphagus sp. GCM10025308]
MGRCPERAALKARAEARNAGSAAKRATGLVPARERLEGVPFL